MLLTDTLRSLGDVPIPRYQAAQRPARGGVYHLHQSASDLRRLLVGRRSSHVIIEALPRSLDRGNLPADNTIR